MRTFAARVLLVLLAQSRPPPSTANTFNFYGVTVSRAMVMNSPSLEEFSIPSVQTLRCSVICGWRSWCDLWCRDASSDVCFFSNIIVTPGYSAEVPTADAMACFTRRPKDLATGAAIDASPHFAARVLRVKENLIDGIYDLQTVDMCYMTLTGEDLPWFVIDFGKPVSVRLVKFFTQPTGQSYWVQSVGNLEVRVGVEPVTMPGDFSAYDHFGHYQGPATKYNQEVVVEAPAPMTARFLSVQKMELSTKIQICHLEVH